MSFAFSRQPRRRRISLTPMIDVVFLLMVFFMLAARFSQDGAIPLSLGGGAEAYSGPPRLVDVLPGGLRLNGVPVAAADLATGLSALVETPGDAILLRPRDGADLDRLVAVMQLLSDAGYLSLVLVE